MDNKEIIQKPNTTFSVMLFILFYFIFRGLITVPSLFTKSIIPDILQSDIPVVCSIVYYTNHFLFLLYGLWSIILVFKGSKNAITCLKLFLPFASISWLISGITIITTTASFYIFILKILFPWILFIYVCKSKKVAEYLPKQDRTIGINGWIGISLYLVYLILIAYIAYYSYLININSSKIDTEKIELHCGELTDGRVIFQPNENWVLDSVVTLDESRDAFYFCDIIQDINISVITTGGIDESARHSYIYTIPPYQPFETKYFKDEVDHNSIENEKDVIYIDQYVYQIDSTKYYWTLGSKLDKKYNKNIRLSIVEKDSLKTTCEYAMDFLNRSIIDIRNRLFEEN